ncbi:MAG: hypothetical protein IPH12_15835 [Saprospirales bacterium]|nr:hypothetical protein [Saprospirales bacterium]
MKFQLQCSPAGIYKLAFEQILRKKDDLFGYFVLKFPRSMLKFLFVSVLLTVSASLQAAAAPDFTITDTEGTVRQLYADFVNQGKVVVLEIFYHLPALRHACAVLAKSLSNGESPVPRSGGISYAERQKRR